MLLVVLLAAVAGPAHAQDQPTPSRAKHPRGVRTVPADPRRRRSLARAPSRPRRSARRRSGRQPADAGPQPLLRRRADHRLEAVHRAERRAQHQPRLLHRRREDDAHLVAVRRPAGLAEEAGAVGRPHQHVHRRRSLVPPGRQPAVVDVAEHLWSRRRHDTARHRHREPQVQRAEALRNGVPPRRPATCLPASGSTSARTRTSVRATASSRPSISRRTPPTTIATASTISSRPRPVPASACSTTRATTASTRSAAGWRAPRSAPSSTASSAATRPGSS